MSKKKEQILEYTPTAGVRADFKRLMNKFLSYNTVRYEHFSEVWRERNMSYLCAGRGTDREAREFIERVIMIAQEYFLPPYQFQVRVGGLYMLYAIYQIQPLVPKVKLRLTPAQWQNTIYFQQQAAQQNHLDVVYVFQRLLQEQAFLFCYTSSEMSIHSSIKDVDDREENLADSLKEEKTAVVNLFNYESLEKLSYVQDQYQQMKIGLAGQNATKPDKSLDVVQGELAEDIVVLLQTFKEKVAAFSKPGQSTEGTSQDKKPTSETTGGRRQLLKSQAYSMTAPPEKRHKSALNNTPPSGAKSTNSETRATTNAGAMQSVTKNSQRPIFNDTSSTGDSDDDCILPKNLVPDFRKQIGQKDKGKYPQKRAVDQAKVVKQVTSSSLNITNSKNSKDSMPILTHVDTSGVNHILLKRAESVSELASVGRDAHAIRLHGDKEHCSGKTTELMMPVRKRGRPRKYNNATEVYVGLNTQLHESSKENPTQANNTSISVEKSNDLHDIIVFDQDHNSVTNKVAFKWKNNGKKADQFAVAKSPALVDNVIERIVTENTAPVRKRGRPRLYFDPTKPVQEIIVHPKKIVNKNSAAGKYEVLYFPTGMKLTSDLKGVSKFTSYLDDIKASKTDCQMPCTTEHTKNNSERDMNNPVTDNDILKSTVKHSHDLELVSKAVNNVIRTSAFKKPAVISPSVTHNSVISSEPSRHTPSLCNTFSTEQNNKSQSLKRVKSTKQSESNAIQRLKERCKRQFEESKADETVSEFVMRCTPGMNYDQTLQPMEKLVLKESTDIGEQTLAGIKSSNTIVNNAHSDEMSISATVKSEAVSNSGMDCFTHTSSTSAYERAKFFPRQGVAHHDGSLGFKYI